MRGAGVAICAATLVFIFGCGQQPVAVVNGSKVTKQAFYDRLKKTAGKDVLAGMIQRQLIEDAFTKAGLTLTDAEIQEKLTEIQAKFPSPDAFKEELDKQGLTMDDLKKELAFQLKVEKLCTKDVKYTEADLQKFFQQYQKAFEKPERVVLSQIQVSSKEEADKVYGELQKPGANFAALARQYSIDPQFREAGGRMPEVPIDKIPEPEIQAAIRAMKPGDISKPVVMQKNFVIFKLEEIKPAEKADFQKQHADIEKQFKARSAKSPQDLLAEVSKNAVVQVIDPDLSSVQKMFMPAEKLPSFGGEKGAPTKGGEAPTTEAPAAPEAPAPAAPEAPATPPAAPAAPAAPPAGK
jgi:foldase protein PrsA